VPLLEVASGYWQRAGALRAKVLAKRRKARLGDALIAQSCIDQNIPLITRDRDFRAFAAAANLNLIFGASARPALNPLVTLGPYGRPLGGLPFSIFPFPLSSKASHRAKIHQPSPRRIPCRLNLLGEAAKLEQRLKTIQATATNQN